MDNYQPTHSLNLSRPGENTIEAQSAGPTHLAQHILGEMNGSTAHLQRTQSPVANEAEEAVGHVIHDVSASQLKEGHERIKFNPIHTCATCTETARSNHALEVHARVKSHQAFLCTCAGQFKTQFTLNRHIAEQTRAKYYCNDCNENKTFLREETLKNHLRTYHKFGEQQVGEIISRAGDNLGNSSGLASSAATTAVAALPMSTPAGHHAALNAPAGGLHDLMEYSGGYAADPFGVIHYGAADFPMGSAAGIQPFSMDGQHVLPSASWDFAGLNSFGAGLPFPGHGFSETGYTGAECPCVGCPCAGLSVAGCLCAEFPEAGCVCAVFSSAGPSGANVAGGNIADFDGDLDMSGMDNGI